MNLLLTKNTTSGYNTIVDDAKDKDAGDYHHEEDTTTSRTENRRKMFLVIGGSVSALVLLGLLFCATPASPSLPSSASVSSSLSSLRTTALEDSHEDTVVDGWFQCYPNGDPCYAGYSFPNGGCCDTASCVRRNGGNSCEVYTDSCVCVNNPTTAPSLPPTKSPTNPPTPPPTPLPTSPPTPPPTPAPSRPPTNAPTTSPPTSPPTPPPSPAPTPPPTVPMYDPNQDFCFTDNDNVGKFCWYPTDNTPVGVNWGGVTGRGYNDCGPKCITVRRYDPSKDFCFQDKDNDGKYCWYTTNKWGLPYGNWEGVTGAAYDNCGPECIY